MPYCCLTDIAGPFYNPDRPFRNWSALPFYQLDQAHPPYVDQEQLDWGVQRALAYLRRIHQQGYTGVVIDNLAHLVGFDHTPVPIYAPDSPYRIRAAVYRNAFGELFDEAQRQQMDVFVTSDMQWATPPLQQFVGRLAAHNPRLATVNQWALDELFTTLPQVSGVMVRVGETGGAHNLLSDYTGHMLYTTAKRLHWLIETLLPVCERHNRLLIVRTWSIGIGELGTMMWSPERYQEVFGRYRSPHLLVSIKHGPTDFFRSLPPNPTSGLPGPAQIIELQNRREYELFGMVPSAVVPLHQHIIQRETTSNRQFAGVWAWNGSGGWGGGRAALGDDGWSVWTELSSALTAALLHEPTLDSDAFLLNWCCQRFGSTFGAAVAAVYRDSASVMEQGWYPGKLSRGKEAFGRIYLPTLLWVWWMRPTASLVVWSYLASAVDNATTAIEASAAACARLAWHRAHLARLADQQEHCPHRAAVLASVEYLHDTITVAHTIRSFLYQAFDAAWNVQRSRWTRQVAQVAQVRAVLQHYRATWGNNENLPPLELDEIETFLNVFERHPRMLWVRARATCVLVQHLRSTASSASSGQSLWVIGLVAALVLLPLLSRKPRTAGGIGVALSVLLSSPLRQRTMRSLVPMLSRRYHLLPSIFFETGPSFTEWMA